MNEVFRRRLIGLAVLLVSIFLLSLLLPTDDNGVPLPPGTAPSTTVSLLESEPSAANTPTETAAAQTTEPAPQTAQAIEAPPLVPPAPAPALKISPTVSQPSKADADKKPKAPAVHAASPPPASKPTVPAKEKEQVTLSPPKPKLAESVTKPAATTVSPAVSTPAQTASATARWYVQVGSFSDQGKAGTIVSLLKNVGYAAEISRVNNAAGSTLYRVRLGPFPTEIAAQQAQQKVARQGYRDSRVVPEGNAGK